MVTKIGRFFRGVIIVVKDTINVFKKCLFKSLESLNWEVFSINVEYCHVTFSITIPPKKKKGGGKKII